MQLVMKFVKITFLLSLIMIGCKKKVSKSDNNSKNLNELQEDKGESKAEFESKLIDINKFCNKEIFVNKLQIRPCSTTNEKSEVYYNDSDIINGIGLHLTKIYKETENFESTITGHEYLYVFCETKQDSIEYGKKGVYNNAISISLYDKKHIGFTIASAKIALKISEISSIKIDDSFEKLKNLFNKTDFELKENSGNKEMWLYIGDSYVILPFNNHDNLEKIVLTNPGGSI